MVRDDSCGSPLNPSPTGGLRLPAGKHTSILTEFQTKVNKKMKKSLFFAPLSVIKRIEPLILCCHYKKVPDTFNFPFNFQCHFYGDCDYTKLHLNVQ